jgi:hypothetical protein
METDVLAIYHLLAQAMVDHIPEEWDKAYLMIKKQEGYIGNLSTGKYTDGSSFIKPFSIQDDDLVFDMADAIDDLHVITTEGGHNRWNLLWFALSPGGAFEIEFIWSQDAEDALTHLSQTHDLQWADRDAALGQVLQAQAERASPLLYDALVRALVELISEPWATATLSLREAGMGFIEHHAAYRTPMAAEDEEADVLHLPYSWPALRSFEQLRRLKFEGEHPDWQQVTFTVTASGSYRAAFINETATDERPAGDYFYDGQWRLPETQVPPG